MDKKPTESASKSKPQDKPRPPWRRGGGLKAFALSLNAVRKRALGRLSPAEAGLHLEWSAIVGASLAAKTQPLRLRFPNRNERRDAVLTVACEPAFALELQHMLPLLIERLNAHFGYGAVARVRLQQTRMIRKVGGKKSPAAGRAALPPAPEPGTEALPDNVADEALARALARLEASTRQADREEPR